MNRRTQKQGAMAMNGFVLTLIAVFALLCTAMILFGVQAYRVVAAETERLAQLRTATGYLTGRMHAVGDANSVRIERMAIDEEESTVLIFSETYDDTTYETRLFCAEGMLREQFCRAEIPLSGAGDGAEIVQMKSFEAYRDDTSLTMVLEHANGTQTRLTTACVQTNGVQTEGSAR